MDFEREYGRYKKKCDELNKQIAELKQDVAGWKELLDVNNAIIAAIIGEVGEVTIARAVVTKAVKEPVPMYCHYDGDADTYTLSPDAPKEAK